MRLGVALLLFGTCGLWAADRDILKAEANLEKRAEKALELANASITTARDAYNSSNFDKTRADLNEAAALTELAHESLKATGKHPRRSPKYFKKAELKIREMLRRLKNLETEFAVDDRAAVVEAERRMQQVHDELIAGIMGPKK